MIDVPCVVYMPALATAPPLSTTMQVHPPPVAVEHAAVAPASPSDPEIIAPSSGQLRRTTPPWLRHVEGMFIVVVMSIAVSDVNVPSLLNVAVPETLGEAEVVAVQPAPIITVLVAPVIQTSDAFHVPTMLPPHGATAPHELSPDEDPLPGLEPQETSAPGAKDHQEPQQHDSLRYA